MPKVEWLSPVGMVEDLVADGLESISPAPLDGNQLLHV